MRLPLLLLLLPLFAATTFAEPESVPEFTREDAKGILVAQEWRDITIVAVVNGVSREKIASPSLSHALALARRDGKWHDLKFDVYYDRALGWFTYESTPEMYRVWNRDGYREIKAFGGF